MTLIKYLFLTVILFGFPAAFAADEESDCFGLFDDEKYEEALPQCIILARQGDVGAQFKLGLVFARGQGVLRDDEKAIHWYTKAGAQGHSKAQNNLGLMYANGQGVPQDYKKAVHWYTKAAKQKYANAQHNLGFSYANGQGLKRDFKQAVYWYTKAAKQGQAVAQHNLGLMYVRGQVVPDVYISYSHDIIEGYAWWSASLTQGNKSASEARKLIEEEMTADELKKAKELAKVYIQKYSK